MIKFTNPVLYDKSVFDGIDSIIADTEHEAAVKRSLLVLRETMDEFTRHVGSDTVDKLRWLIFYTDGIPTKLYVTWDYLDEQVLRLVLTDQRECSISITLHDSSPFTMSCYLMKGERPLQLLHIADLLRRITSNS